MRANAAAREQDCSCSASGMVPVIEDRRAAAARLMQASWSSKSASLQLQLMLPVRAGPEGGAAARRIQAWVCSTGASLQLQQSGNPLMRAGPGADAVAGSLSAAPHVHLASIHSLSTSMQPFRRRLGLRTPGQKSAHLPPAALWRREASRPAPVEPAWPAELQLLWLRGAAGACLRLLRTLQGQQDQTGLSAPWWCKMRHQRKWHCTAATVCQRCRQLVACCCC